MERKTSLIAKYNITLNKLDFKYIEECQNAGEMEKIVHILRSGEEGCYPDLTTCAENKLRQLKPQSRHFRIEEPIRGHDALSASELRPIYDWSYEVKNKDKTLEAGKMSHENVDLAPVRKTGFINIVTDKESQIVSRNKKDNIERIKSTDYQKWDKFDPDEECLKLDLADERRIEEVECQNILNRRQSMKIIEIEKKLDAERGELSNEF